MPTTTITALPAASALAGTEVLPIDQAGATKKATAQDIADLAAATLGTDLAYDASTRALSSSTGDGVTLPLHSPDAAGLQPPSQYTALTYAATVNIDMAALHGQTRTISLTGNLGLTFSNMAAGRWVALRLVCDASLRTLTFPAGLVFYGGAAPANIAANKEAKFAVEFYGTTDASGRAGYAVQP
jgi:uncharacterized protein YijF (DUF1287 family)